MVSITSNISWNASVSGNWFTINTTSGANNSILSISVPSHYKSEARTGSIHITGGTLSGIVSITQTGFSGLLAYYPFNGNANNEVNIGYNGLISGPTLTEDHTGNPESAYSFDGQTNLIDLGTELGNFGKGDFSLSYMFKLEGSKGSFFSPDIKQNQYVLSKNGTDLFSGLLITPSGEGKLILRLWVNNRGISTPNENKFDNNWHSVVVIKSNNVVSTYYDGIFSTSTFSDPININNFEPLYIGASTAMGPTLTYFKGKIDEVRIYNKALSETEANQLNTLNSVTGINDFDINQDIVISPNPAKTKLIISNHEGSNASIYNILGVLVLKTEITSNPIDIASLQSGLYLVHIEKNGKKAIIKLVVEK